jgi:hypothetical protein
LQARAQMHPERQERSWGFLRVAGQRQLFFLGFSVLKKNHAEMEIRRSCVARRVAHVDFTGLEQQFGAASTAHDLEAI